MYIYETVQEPAMDSKNMWKLIHETRYVFRTHPNIDDGVSFVKIVYGF